MAKSLPKKIKEPPTVAVPQTSSITAELVSSPRHQFLLAIVFVLSLIPFVPALENGFVNWDDDHNIIENPYYRGLGWSQLLWMFSTFHLGHYQPLSWLSLGLDYVLWGMEPFGYHLTNLLLHGANAVLFLLVTLKCLQFATGVEETTTHRFIAAAFAALIFAVHPLRVESVAWATERRDLLSGSFLLASVLCYFRAAVAAESRGRWLTWSRGSLCAVTSFQGGRHNLSRYLAAFGHLPIAPAQCLAQWLV